MQPSCRTPKVPQNSGEKGEARTRLLRISFFSSQERDAQNNFWQHRGHTTKNEHKLYLHKLYQTLRNSGTARQISGMGLRDIPENVVVLLGFRRGNKLFDPRPLAWKIPTPQGRLWTAKVNLYVLEGLVENFKRATHQTLIFLWWGILEVNWYSAERAGVKRVCPKKVMAHKWFMHDAHLGRAFLFLDILAEYALLSIKVMVAPCLWYVVGMKLVISYVKFRQAPFARAPFGNAQGQD